MRLLEWIDAAQPRQGLVQTARIRAQHLMALFSLTVGLPYALFFQWMGVSWSVWLLGPLTVIVPASVLFFTRRGRPALGGYIVSVGPWLFISGALVARGGMFSNAAAWLLIVPVFSTFLVGPGHGTLMALATAATYGAVWGAQELGAPLPAGLPPEVLHWMPLVDYPLIALLIGGILFVQAGVWEGAEREALHAAQARYTFLATMSHEIRTPLNGVLGLTEVLLDTSLSAPQRELAATIKRSGTLLRALLDDVLDFSKIDSGVLERELLVVDLPTLCRDVLRLWEGTAKERGLTLALDLADGAPVWVTVDSTKLRQILGNLLSNALKFTPEGGTVTLALEAAGEQLVVHVRDTGIGMSPAQCERVFEPFVQGDGSTTRRFGGTGLGLSICRRLARFLGGELTVTSVPEAGSDFVVRLPLTPAAPPVLEATPEAQELLTGLRVLVAEDNPVNQLVITRLLERHGVVVRLTSDGEACVRDWQAHPADLILMDCQMPGCDGYEATRRIRELGGEVPIIALTANSMAGDRARCLAVGMNDHLGKPVEPAALAATLRTWKPRVSPDGR